MLWLDNPPACPRPFSASTRKEDRRYADNGQLESMRRHMESTSHPDLIGADSPSRGATARTATFSVENMNCGGCMAKIERVLKAEPAVAAARANLSTKRVTVTFDPARASDAGLIAILEDAGFTAAEFVAADM